MAKKKETVKMTNLYPSPSHPPQAKSSDALKREELKSAAEMFTPPPAPPSPPTPAELPEHLFTPSPAQVASACSCNGNDEGRARTSYIASGRATLQRLRTLLPGTAQAIAADLARAEAVRLGALAALATSTERLNELKGALLERTDLRQRIAGMKADLENSIATLASPESLKMDGPTLALMGTKRQHLPSEVADLTAELPPMTERIERLASELKVALPVLIAGLYAEANQRVGSTWIDVNFKRLHESGAIWP